MPFHICKLANIDSWAVQSFDEDADLRRFLLSTGGNARWYNYSVNNMVVFNKGKYSEILNWRSLTPTPE